MKLQKSNAKIQTLKDEKYKLKNKSPKRNYYQKYNMNDYGDKTMQSKYLNSMVNGTTESPIIMVQN